MGLLERALEVALAVIGTSEEGLPESLLFEDDHPTALTKQEEEEQYREEAALHTAGPGKTADFEEGGSGVLPYRYTYVHTL